MVAPLVEDVREELDSDGVMADLREKSGMHVWGAIISQRTASASVLVVRWLHHVLVLCLYAIVPMLGWLGLATERVAGTSIVSNDGQRSECLAS